MKYTVLVVLNSMGGCHDPLLHLWCAVALQSWLNILTYISIILERRKRNEKKGVDRSDTINDSAPLWL